MNRLSGADPDDQQHQWKANPDGFNVTCTRCGDPMELYMTGDREGIEGPCPGITLTDSSDD